MMIKSLHPLEVNINNIEANNLKQDFTELRPDEESSPLKLSKEQLGRFSW